MAGNTRKRKPSNNKKSNTRSKSSSQKNTGSSYNKEFYNEIFLVVGITISLLIMLSSFGLIGTLGTWINTVTFGILGITAYLFPVLLCFDVCILVANRGNSLAKKKMIYSFIFLFIISGMIQLFQYEDNTKLVDLFIECANKKQGGGWIGGLLTNLLYPLTKFWGTFIILSAFLVIMIILISEKLIVSNIASKSYSKMRNIFEDIKYSEYSDDEDEDQDYVTKAEYVNRRQRRKPAKTFKFSEDSSEDVSNTTQKSKKISKHEINDDLSAGANDDLNDNSRKKTKRKKLPSGMTELNTAGVMADNQIPEPKKNANSYTVDKETGEIYENELRLKFKKNKQNPENENNMDSSKVGIENVQNEDSVLTASDLKEQQMPVTASFTETVPTPVAPSFTENVQQTISQEAATTSHDYPINSNAANSNSTNSNAANSNSTNSNATNNNATTSHNSTNLNANKLNSNPSDSYQYPSLDLLDKPKKSSKNGSNNEQFETAQKLEETLKSFGVKVTVTDISVGPTVTRYEMQPEQGVKVSRITNLSDDIKLNLAATDIRIEAPIPGKAAVGIEVPNKEAVAVPFRELLESDEFQKSKSNLAFAVGKDLAGQPIVTDIAKMPHLLIAGQTGSGKSVCINTLIMSILFKYHPDDVKLIMVDPKVVELSVYNGAPHLMIPVVTDAKKASQALNWAVAEMVDRYNKFAQLNVRNIAGYNERVESVENSEEAGYEKMPQIVIIVDELADLMMVAPGEVEDAICRLAQMARAAGIHLVIATQRPSVNVITGLIKANVPSRIAFSVASAIDSRTILDSGGAEKLLGKGDMLFYASGTPKPVRLQGAFVSDKEVNAVVEFLKSNNENTYSEEIIEKIENAAPQSVLAENKANGQESGNDQYFAEAGKFIIEKEKASIGMLQRVYKIGFNRAARIMDQLAQAGVVGPEEGTKPRKILMTMEEFEQYLNDNAQ